MLAVSGIGVECVCVGGWYTWSTCACSIDSEYVDSRCNIDDWNMGVAVRLKVKGTWGLFWAKGACLASEDPSPGFGFPPTAV